MVWGSSMHDTHAKLETCLVQTAVLIGQGKAISFGFDCTYI